jgi:hypothetical protein
MKTLEEIKGRCIIEPGDREGEEHWIWQGALGGPKDNRVPYVWGPVYVEGQEQPTMRSQSVARAIIHIQTGAPIPEGKMPYRICNHEHCVNQACTRLMTHKQWGRYAAKHKLLPQRYDTAAAAMKTWDTRGRRYDTETVRKIASSGRRGRVLERAFGISRSYANKIQRGTARTQVGKGVFAGLFQ